MKTETKFKIGDIVYFTDKNTTTIKEARIVYCEVRYYLQDLITIKYKVAVPNTWYPSKITEDRLFASKAELIAHYQYLFAKLSNENEKTI